ncbi:MAG: DUF2911 domain-containing protein [Bacteroidetes bacterium]|nr:DUF2911 domain-containing protein [Bacteroidota bacterium]
MKYLSLLTAALLLNVAVQAQELKLPAMSPGAKISQDFSTSNIEITYSRPSMRGRKIFGDLVPYGEVWRTGANSATKIKFGEDVTVGGQVVKAGEYALYTIPSQTEWTVIINKGTGNWGNAGYDVASDVARFKITPKMSDKNVQTFTINIGNITFNSCNLELMWEKTKIVIPIKANNEERLNANIDKAINHPTVPYFSAANYYFETNQSLDKAYEYVNKALETNDKAFYMWNLKARIAQKMGKNAEGIAAAEKSIETAKGSAFESEYAHKGNKLIAEMKKRD